MAERCIRLSPPVRFGGPNKRYIVRSKSSAVLLALALATLAPSLGKAQYAPKWHVGDWWVTKTLREYQSGRGTYWRCDYNRHDVAAIEKVGKNDCYVIEIRGSSRPSIGRDGAASIVLHIRADNWLVVRTEHVRQYGGKRISPDVRNYPRGLFGPSVSEPRLPRFPLQIVNPDTAFKTENRIYGVADLREVSRPADPALVERLLAEGDTADIRVVRPSGVVYQVRNDLGGNFIPGPQPGEREIMQSLQLWSDDLPWRLYEELVDYRGPKHVGTVQERSWLVAVGKREK